MLRRDKSNKPERVYSDDELRAMIVRMKATSNRFYAEAVQIGNHPFIEFCGLMNEYIKSCEAAVEDGIDFTQCNQHSGFTLPLPAYSRDYITDKLTCIFVGHDKISNAIR